MVAPVLVFTMEEVWLERFPGDQSSVHLVDFPETPSAWRDDALATKWAVVRNARRVVTGALEVERTAKVIGSSLEAAPTVYVDDQTAAILDTVQFDDMCITSGISVTSGPVPEGAFSIDDVPGVGASFAKADGAKCARCWKVLPDVGMHSQPGVCGRCNEALG